MKTVKVEIKSLSPLSQSRYHKTEKLEKENHNDYEKRTWRERLHSTEDGHVFIPPMAFKKALETAARFIGMKIPGKGKSQYTKHFKAGVLVREPLILDIKKDEVQGQWLHVPSDGRSGGTTRVEKCFSMIPEWSGEITFYILDDTITQDVFEYHMKEAGNFIGIGTFRPERGGYFGRFEVTKYIWQ